jgi:hypothetical protein
MSNESDFVDNIGKRFDQSLSEAVDRLAAQLTKCEQNQQNILNQIESMRNKIDLVMNKSTVKRPTRGAAAKVGGAASAVTEDAIRNKLKVKVTGPTYCKFKSEFDEKWRADNFTDEWIAEVSADNKKIKACRDKEDKDGENRLLGQLFWSSSDPKGKEAIRAEYKDWQVQENNKDTPDEMTTSS